MVHGVLLFGCCFAGGKGEAVANGVPGVQRKVLEYWTPDRGLLFLGGFCFVVS